MTAYILRRKALGKTSTEAIQSLSKTGITVYRNDQELPQDADLCIRWGCTSKVPKTSQGSLNKSDAIHLVADKAGFRKVLQDAHAHLVPKTWFPPYQSNNTFPCILRPTLHAQGKQIYLCNNPGDILNAMKHTGPKHYLSEFIPKVAEYRVFIIQGRVVCVAQKTVQDPTQIAWNVAQGGKFENVKWGKWPLPVIQAAITAFTLSGLDFGGVDVMVDADGKPYILEINSACSLTSPYRQQCFTKAFDHIVTNGKEPIPVESHTHWSFYIHPALV